MIEVEIRGPIAKKEYDKLKKLLSTAGENFRTEKRMFIDYSKGGDGGIEKRTLDVRLKQKGKVAEISIKKGPAGDWSEREEVEVKLASGEFSNMVRAFALLGYAKGVVCMRDMVHARYGGADFTLADPGEDLFYYEAEVVVQNPTDAAEAKARLTALAKKMKLPVWGQNEMFAFIHQLNERVNYVYDYKTDGPDHFKERFGI
jgi:adenylate cyclase class IV